MKQIAIQATGVSKKYSISHQLRARPSTLRSAVTDGLSTLAQRFFPSSNSTPTRAHKEDYWALDDVSFEINQGDRIGIIGRNGAGKSTLLKLLSRITAPSAGEIQIHGRVACLLEVGAGFHPELTGRENIYLNGAIMGMSKAEISAKFDKIVAFAEIDKFLDTPVKRYSSGMYVRLAYSVAAHLESDVLIVDEVLAVGDFAFQKKCLDNMNDIANDGRTVVLVSHNMLSIQDLCSKALWLHNGKCKQQGEVNAVISGYLQTTTSYKTNRSWQEHNAPGNNEVRLLQAKVAPVEDYVSHAITVDCPFVIEFTIQTLTANASFNVSMHLYNTQGILILDSAPGTENRWLNQPQPTGVFKYTCKIPGDLLNNGQHRITLFVTKERDIVLYKEEDILIFEVVDSAQNRAGWYGNWEGVIRPNLHWRAECLHADESTT